jgi:hypothetical protein
MALEVELVEEKKDNPVIICQVNLVNEICRSVVALSEMPC